MVMIVVVGLAGAAGLCVVCGKYGGDAQHTLHFAHGFFALSAQGLHSGAKLGSHFDAEANVSFAKDQTLNKARRDNISMGHGIHDPGQCLDDLFAGDLAHMNVSDFFLMLRVPHMGGFGPKVKAARVARGR